MQMASMVLSSSLEGYSRFSTTAAGASWLGCLDFEISLTVIPLYYKIELMFFLE
jgi:hypothetical protein